MAIYRDNGLPAIARNLPVVSPALTIVTLGKRLPVEAARNRAALQRAFHHLEDRSMTRMALKLHHIQCPLSVHTQRTAVDKRDGQEHT